PRAYLYHMSADQVKANTEPLLSYMGVDKELAPLQLKIQYESMGFKLPGNYQHNNTYYFRTLTKSPYFIEQYVLRLQLKLDGPKTYRKSRVAVKHPIRRTCDLLLLDEDKTLSDTLLHSQEATDVYDPMELSICFKLKNSYLMKNDTDKQLIFESATLDPLDKFD
ncbi:hypothetical protein GZH46_00435, partial [Fragariocoptes setiger]